MMVLRLLRWGGQQAVDTPYTTGGWSRRSPGDQSAFVARSAASSSFASGLLQDCTDCTDCTEDGDAVEPSIIPRADDSRRGRAGRAGRISMPEAPKFSLD